MATLLTEKTFQKLFVEKLKMYNWLVKQQISDMKHQSRMDIIAYNPAFNIWFGFELKVPKSVKDYTKCLRQMIRYKQAVFQTKPDVFCLITPHNVSREYNDNGFIITRFFWRWGFGVGDYESMNVKFVNGESLVTLDLENPYSGYYDPKEQIKEVKKRVEKYWGGIYVD